MVAKKGKKPAGGAKKKVVKKAKRK